MAVLDPGVDCVNVTIALIAGKVKESSTKFTKFYTCSDHLEVSVCHVEAC